VPILNAAWIGTYVCNSGGYRSGKCWGSLVSELLTPEQPPKPERMSRQLRCRLHNVVISWMRAADIFSAVLCGVGHRQDTRRCATILVANSFLLEEIERLTRAVSLGFTRQRSPSRKASEMLDRWREITAGQLPEVE
jgi:hypothetical protein